MGSKQKPASPILEPIGGAVCLRWHCCGRALCLTDGDTNPRCRQEFVAQRRRTGGGVPAPMADDSFRFLSGIGKTCKFVTDSHDKEDVVSGSLLAEGSGHAAEDQCCRYRRAARRGHAAGHRLCQPGPLSGTLRLSDPGQPLLPEAEEDAFWISERYDRAPVLGPLTEGGPDTALDPPSDDEVMRTFERAIPQQGGIPFLYECQRNNVRIVKEKIADYIDPPRVFPLIGPAQGPPLPLQVHDLLHPGRADRLAAPAHAA